MTLQERKSFIKDEKKNMTIEEKNRQLSAALATTPQVKRKIVLISRIEIGATGWWIHYRVGRP